MTLVRKSKFYFLPSALVSVIKNSFALQWGKKSGSPNKTEINDCFVTVKYSLPQVFLKTVVLFENAKYPVFASMGTGATN